MRSDAAAILDAICVNCWPAILNIPTNGLLPERIARSVAQVTGDYPDIQFVVNLSIDGWGEDHDRIRGVAGGFERALETYRRLRALEAPNLTLGIHTVISRFNAGAVPDLYRRVHDELAPDSYISEIAEEREELGTVGAGITPGPAAYDQAIEGLIRLQSGHPAEALGRVTWAFRRRYYRMVRQWLRERRQVIPCYAGWASGQIAPDGDVWFCCVNAESVGNLREADYEFSRIWWSDRAQSLREEIRAGRCDCPLANAAYTNLLLHPPSLAGVAWDLVRGDGRR
jgi:MoaA/NifB/PqqE/SkfB family radical SAM enzyme